MRHRDSLFLLAALGLHGIVVGAVRTAAPTRSAETVERKPDELLEIDFDLEEKKAPANVAPPEPTARATETPRATRRVAPREKTPEAHPKESPGVEETPSAEAAPSPTATAEAWLDGKPPQAPGLDEKPIWAVPGVLPPAAPLASAIAAAPPPVVPSAPPASTGPLAAALDYLASGNPPKPSARVAPALHFPAAGTLASALATEVRGSSTPVDSEGVVELVINAKGKLISVHVVTADPKYRKEWDQIASVVAQRFASQTFPLPDAYAGGSRIRVTLKVRFTLPDGSKQNIHAPQPKIPGLPNEHEIREESLDDRYRGGGGKAGLPPMSLAGGLSFDFDVANIGAKKRRVVHTRIHAAPLGKATSEGAADPSR